MRRVDWTERLAQTLEGRRHYPFVWAGRDGCQDCCTLAAACASAITGRPILDELLTHYHDETSALEYIKACGGLAAAVSSHLGKSKAGSLARTGDIAIVVVKRKEIVGVVVDDEIIAAGADGLGSYPRARAVLAWSL
jgi:hypothetical protein